MQADADESQARNGPALGLAQPGRRERKKAATRQAIIDAGFGLFATKGFAETTVTEIAAAADVSDGTFYFHFHGGKLELLYQPVEERMRTLVAQVGCRRDGETTLQVFEAFLRQAIDPSLPIERHLALARQTIITDAAVAGAVSERARTVSDSTLRSSLASEFQVSDSDLGVRIVASFALELWRDYARLLGAEDPTPHQVEDFLQRGFAALRAAQRELLDSS